MSKSRNLSSVSKYRTVSAQNTHCAQDLRSEIAKLEHQRTNRLRELSHQTNQVRRLSTDVSAIDINGPSARPVRRGSLTTGLSPSNARADLAQTAESSPTRKDQATGSSTTKKSAAKKIENATQQQPTLPPVNHKKKEVVGKDNVATSMPQIIISGHDCDPEVTTKVEVEGGKTSLAGQGHRRGSLISNGSVGSLSSDSESLSQSSGNLLELRYQRSRSNSVPAVIPLQPPPRPARRASYCPEPLRDLDTMTSPRSRSSSVSMFVAPKRRGSLSESRDLTAEREPGKSSRRRSVQLDRMLRNLTFGLRCRELDYPEERKGIDPKDWEELKNCRYLRVPGRDDPPLSDGLNYTG